MRRDGSPRRRVPLDSGRVSFPLLFCFPFFPSNATLPTNSYLLALLRPHSAFSAAGPKCYNCQQFGHIARSCPNATIAPVDGQTVAPVAAPAVVAPVVPFPRVPLGARIGGYAPRGGFMGARGGFMGAAAARGQFPLFGQIMKGTP